MIPEVMLSKHPCCRESWIQSCAPRQGWYHVSWCPCLFPKSNYPFLILRAHLSSMTMHMCSCPTIEDRVQTSTHAQQLSVSSMFALSSDADAYRCSPTWQRSRSSVPRQEIPHTFSKRGLEFRAKTDACRIEGQSGFRNDHALAPYVQGGFNHVRNGASLS